MDEAKVRRLAWAVQHEPVYYRGVSEEAVRTLRGIVGDLETADPSVIQEDKNARRHIRYLAALIPDDVPDEHLAMWVADVINNPLIVPAHIEDVFHDPNVKGLDGARIRRIGSLLRAGHSYTQVQQATGVARQEVANVAAFLGVSSAKEAYLLDVAADYVEEQGLDPEPFATRFGVSKNKARQVLETVARGLGIEGGEAGVTA